MQKPLEAYLSELERRLGSLPKPRRDEELKEVRHHLESAIAANREEGQSESLAIANAIADFGAPEEAAKTILGAWQRFLRKNSRKTFCIIEGMWSMFAAFQILVGSSSAADVRLWATFWILSVALTALGVLLPPYLPQRSRA